MSKDAFLVTGGITEDVDAVVSESGHSQCKVTDLNGDQSDWITNAWVKLIERADPGVDPRVAALIKVKYSMISL